MNMAVLVLGSNRNYLCIFFFFSPFLNFLFFKNSFARNVYRGLKPTKGSLTISTQPIELPYNLYCLDTIEKPNKLSLSNTTLIDQNFHYRIELH